MKAWATVVLVASAMLAGCGGGGEQTAREAPAPERTESAIEPTTPRTIPGGTTAGETTGGLTATTIQVEVGQRFPIALEANSTTGYEWRLEGHPNEEVVQLVGSEYRGPEHVIPGAGGKEVFTFRAVGRGKAVISLWYTPAWEDDRPALIRRFVVVVG